LTEACGTDRNFTKIGKFLSAACAQSCLGALAR
jgi:hypothetical protein